MTAERSSWIDKVRFGIGLTSLIWVSAVAGLALWAFAVPPVLGWSPVAIMSGSMGPGIDTGDIVVAAPHQGTDLGPGTVVVYDNPTGEGRITHRIVDVTASGDYVTRGDANGRIDSTPVPPHSVRAVGRLLVPFIGRPYVWAAKGEWERVLVAGLALAIALWTCRWGLLHRFDPWRAPTGSDADARIGGGALPVTSPASTLSAIAVGFLTLASIVTNAGSDAAFADATGDVGNSLTADTLVAPTKVTATGGASVTIDWVATADTYASGHRVLRATIAGGPYTQIAQITPRTTTTYLDNPSPGTYYYVVRAFHLNWESVDSNETSATVGSSTISHDADSSWSGSGTTESWTHTIGAGSNRILIVTTASEREQADSVTFNGLPLTLIGRQADDDDESRISMWYRLNPATGPGTIEVTFSDSGRDETMGASSWSGVHQSTPIGTFVSQPGESIIPSITVPSASGEVVVDAVSNIDAESVTVDPSQTEHWNENLDKVTGGHSSETGAASVTMSWTMPNDFWAIGAVPLKPA